MKYRRSALAALLTLASQALVQPFYALELKRSGVAGPQPLERGEPDLRVARSSKAPAGSTQRTVDALQLLLAELVAQQPAAIPERAPQYLAAGVSQFAGSARLLRGPDSVSCVCGGGLDGA